MRLLLLRHGPAGERDPIRWPDDGLRPLSDRGRQRTAQAIRGVLSQVPDITLVFASPLLRAHQTGEALAKATGAGLRTLESLAPGGSWRGTLEALQEVRGARDGTLALVGHEPDLGKFAGVLLFGAPRSLALKKAGACLIAFAQAPAAGGGELLWFATPGMLRALRKKAKCRT